MKLPMMRWACCCIFDFRCFWRLSFCSILTLKCSICSSCSTFRLFSSWMLSMKIFYRAFEHSCFQIEKPSLFMLLSMEFVSRKMNFLASCLLLVYYLRLWKTSLHIARPRTSENQSTRLRMFSSRFSIFALRRNLTKLLRSLRFSMIFSQTSPD